MAKVFITGITGFLGSNIARYLAKEGHELIATFRSGSSKSLCADFDSSIHWVLQSDHWAESVINFEPQIVIHSAWIGVGHADRDNWDTQYQNVDYLNTVLNIARQSKALKFISLGSQAEYGLFSGCIDETYPVNPTEAYGYIKLICAELVKQYCTYHQMHWYWLRLFSFFGKGEAPNWLIPSLVGKILSTDHMDFTPGEQKYAYLFVDDLGRAVSQIINHRDDASGIYNISGSQAIQLKELIQKITQLINPSFQLNFGKLPYRPNQPMHMQGDSSKFKKLLGDFEVSDFDDSLNQTIVHLKKMYSNHSTQ